jgi:hypothetical protein
MTECLISSNYEMIGSIYNQESNFVASLNSPHSQAFSGLSSLLQCGLCSGLNTMLIDLNLIGLRKAGHKAPTYRQIIPSSK